MIITWTQVAWGIGLFLAWNGFLVGVIRWLLSREVGRFENKLAEADAKAGKALAMVTEQKQQVMNDLAGMRLEFERKGVCGNHERLEGNDDKLFGRLDQLHGDVRELLGSVKALANSVELLNRHHLNGGE